MNTSSYVEALRDGVEDITSEEDFELLPIPSRCSLLLSWFRSTTPDSVEVYLNAQGPGAIEELCAAFSALLPTIEELKNPNLSDRKRLKSKAVTHRTMPGARAVAFAVSLTLHGSKLITAIISDHPEAAPSVIEGLVDAAEVLELKCVADRPHVNISCSIGKAL